VLGSGSGKLDEAVSIGFDKSSIMEGINAHDSMFLDGVNAIQTARKPESQEDGQA
jgi:hypothetical protein